MRFIAECVQATLATSLENWLGDVKASAEQRGFTLMEGRRLMRMPNVGIRSRQ
jgi:hypothetical protein